MMARVLCLRCEIFCLLLRCVRAAVLVCRPDGKKKAYVRLAPDYDALDVANKVREVMFHHTTVLSHPLFLSSPSLLLLSFSVSYHSITF